MTTPYEEALTIIFSTEKAMVETLAETFENLHNVVTNSLQILETLSTQLPDESLNLLSNIRALISQYTGQLRSINYQTESMVINTKEQVSYYNSVTPSPTEEGPLTE